MPTIRKGSIVSGGTRKSRQPEMTNAEREAIDRRLPAARAWQADEHAFQKSLIAEMNLRTGWEPRLKRLYAVPNGGHRNAAAAGKMKAEGQKTGVPDLCLPIAAGGFHGFYLELKKAGNGPPPDQWEWLLELHRGGYAAFVANDVNTARNLILSYLAL